LNHAVGHLLEVVLNGLELLVVLPLHAANWEFILFMIVWFHWLSMSGGGSRLPTIASSSPCGARVIPIRLYGKYGVPWPPGEASVRRHVHFAASDGDKEAFLTGFPFNVYCR